MICYDSHIFVLLEDSKINFKWFKSIVFFIIIMICISFDKKLCFPPPKGSPGVWWVLNTWNHRPSIPTTTSANYHKPIITHHYHRQTPAIAFLESFRSFWPLKSIYWAMNPWNPLKLPFHCFKWHPLLLKIPAAIFCFHFNIITKGIPSSSHLHKDEHGFIVVNFRNFLWPKSCMLRSQIMSRCTTISVKKIFHCKF